MTDVYISCAAVDADRVRSIVHALRSEGWSVLCEPPAQEQPGDMEDPRSVSAGAVVVAWTAASRESSRVRAEASNALYKNKLIQIRMDEHNPPRPFDQVDSVDLSAWWGWPEDAGWRAVLGAVRLFAGPPGAAAERPQVMRKVGARTAQPTYLEPERTPGPAAYAVAAAGVAAIVGAAAWFMLPSMWRGGEAVARTPAPLAPTANAVAARASGSAEPLMAATLDVGAAAAQVARNPEATAAWAAVDRKNPAALRRLAMEHSGTDASESAKALLRVLDAQTWVAAVSEDTEAAYRAYLASFPAEAALPGAMVSDAARRLAELGVERSQAITELQKNLSSAGLYRGAADGMPGARTEQSAKTFAERVGVRAPDLATAAPRDIRAFSDLLTQRAAAPAVATQAVELTTVAATRSLTPTAPAASPATTGPATTGLASTGLAPGATLPAAALPVVPEAARSEADDLARTQLLQADEAAWQQARSTNTVAAYRSYLSSFPTGLHVAEARRAAIPAAFSLDALAPDVRAAVSAARQTQTRAQSRAAAARDAAARANAAAEAARNGAEGARVVTAPDGDRFEAEVVGSEVTGVGVRIDADAVSRGDVYRGELRAGLSEGVGVYEFGDNPNNAAAGAVRYEGEHNRDGATGAGVTVWKNGDRFAGDDGRGVFTFADGRRYEGQLRNGQRNGVGVVWSASGEPLMAGRWENGQLVEPIALPALPPG